MTAKSSARNGLFLFIALMRMVTFRMKVVHNLSVWALRACSYKTKAEDWAAGHRPPSSSRGLSWFLSCLKQGVQEARWVQGVQEVQEVQGAQWVQVVQVVQKVQEVQWDLSNDCLSLSSPFLFLTISHPRDSHSHALYIYKVRA